MTASILLQVVDEPTATSGWEALQRISGKIGFRYLINLVSVFVMIRFVYYPIYKKRELFFTFFIFNTVIFLICYLLNKVDLSMGAAFGLFAVFSMLRYRTEDISIKDMTYLFLMIAMGLVTAVTKIKDASEEYEYLFLIFINTVLILLTWLLEGRMLMRSESVKSIYYENIELIRNEHRAELIEDIRARTGINVHRVHIQKIDFLKDAAIIKIYYYED